MSFLRLLHLSYSRVAEYSDFHFNDKSIKTMVADNMKSEPNIIAIGALGIGVRVNTGASRNVPSIMVFV